MADEQVFNDENDLPMFLESVLDKVQYVFQSDFDLEVTESHAEILDQSIRLITSISECADAYFDSVDGRTPPRWSSTSLMSSPDCSGSFRRSCIINTNCFDGFLQARC